MVLLYVTVLVIACAAAASWAAGAGSLRRLWLTGAATLLLVAMAAVLLGRHHGVPSLARLLLYAIVFAGPIVLTPTMLLSFSPAPPSGWTGRLPGAILSACIGAIVGWFLVVFGLGVW